jgi:hypothetical protein
VAALLLSACVGDISKPPGGDISEPGEGRMSARPSERAAPDAGGSSGGSDAGTSGAARGACNTPPNLGPTPLRRLTRVEYRNTVADLFDIAPPSSADLPDDGADSRGFTTTTSQPISPEGALKYFEVATTVGENLMAKLPALFSCARGQTEDECIRKLLASTGTKIFRRPLTEAEHDHFAAVFAKARADEATVDEAVLTVLQTMLVSPQFLFIMEPSQASPSEATKLDSWQVATRLSYLLWQTTPDAELLDAASRDELVTKPAVAAQTARLLDSPRAKAAIAAFFDQWLMLRDIEKVQKDPDVFPSVTELVVAALARESRIFVEEFFWSHDGSLGRLFISPLRVRSATLSEFYGDSLSTADDPELAEDDVTERSFGLFSQAGFLMAISKNDDHSAIFRGKLVHSRLFCKPIFLPPPGVATPLPVIEPGVTGRERIEMHTGSGVCVSCHGQFNPFGFALEHFDATGRWRETEGELAIDTAAEVEGSGLGPFDGARDLSSKLANSEQVDECAVSQMFQYAMRREITSADACDLASLNRIFSDSKQNMKELLVAITQSDAFFARIEPKD